MFGYDEVLAMDIERLDPHMHRFMGKWGSWVAEGVKGMR